jgi:MSHA pilin protein MshC
MRGYSLIELVVTLVIMGVLTAIAIPYFNQPEIDVTWFTEQSKAAVRYAQRQAVAQRRSVFVRITSATTLVLCYDDSDACASAVQQAPTGAAYALTAPSGVNFSPSPHSFSFNGLGQPSPISGSSFSVSGKTVAVTAETGYVP